jgi:type IV pilus assembly protein PilA
MLKQTQKGFTLIELMIVVAIIGILAAIALPAYQDYATRSKISEVMIAASACKTGVSEFIQSNGSFPADADAAGCSTTATKYVAAGTTVTDTTGAVTVTIQGTGSAADGEAIILQPTSDAARTTALTAATEVIQGWSCGTDADSGLYKYFPAPCRQAILGGL